MTLFHFLKKHFNTAAFMSECLPTVTDTESRDCSWQAVRHCRMRVMECFHTPPTHFSVMILILKWYLLMRIYFLYMDRSSWAGGFHVYYLCIRGYIWRWVSLYHVSFFTCDYLPKKGLLGTHCNVSDVFVCVVKCFTKEWLPCCSCQWVSKTVQCLEKWSIQRGRGVEISRL